MSTLTLIRPKEISNRYFSYPIFVNGRHVTDLANNSEQTITVEGEQIDIKANILWCGSPTESFDITDQENLTVEIRGNSFYNLTAPILGCLMPGLMSISYFLSDSKILELGLLCVAVLLFFYLLYILTFDRNSWIRISKVG